MRSGIRTAVPIVELHVSGRLDTACLPEFREALDAAVRLRPNRLVVDLSDCCGIDAAAIGLLLDVHRDLLRADSSLTLRAPTRQLRRTLAIARVDQVLRVLPEVSPTEHPDPVYPSAARSVTQPASWPRSPAVGELSVTPDPAGAEC